MSQSNGTTALSEPVKLRRCALLASQLTAPRDLSWEDWQYALATLHAFEGAIQWWIGDLLNYGEERWGEMWTQTEARVHWAPHTLQNWKYVAGKVPPSRRRESLPWSHHAEVASLPPDEQDELLRAAEPEAAGAAPRLTRDDLRAQVRTRTFDVDREMTRLTDYLSAARRVWPEEERPRFIERLKVVVHDLEAGS